MILAKVVATVEWTDEEIAQLRAAIASGVLTVSYSGPPSRTITYQSLDQMRALLADMVSSTAAAAGRPTYRRAAVSKGFRSGCGSGWRRNE